MHKIRIALSAVLVSALAIATMAIASGASSHQRSHVTAAPVPCCEVSTM